MRGLVAAALLVFAVHAVAAELWRVQPGEGRLTFTAWWEDTAVQGEFPAFDADIRFDPEEPETGRFEVEVDLTRVTTGVRDVDDALKGADWFHFGRHPRARFATEGIRRTGPGRYEADARLSMKGVTRELLFPFTWKGDGESARLRSTLELDRGRWGIGAGEWAGADPIALRVQVQVDLRLRAAPDDP